MAGSKTCLKFHQYEDQMEREHAEAAALLKQKVTEEHKAQEHVQESW